MHCHGNGKFTKPVPPAQLNAPFYLIGIAPRGITGTGRDGTGVENRWDFIPLDLLNYLMERDNNKNNPVKKNDEQRGTGNAQPATSNQFHWPVTNDQQLKPVGAQRKSHWKRGDQHQVLIVKSINISYFNDLFTFLWTSRNTIIKQEPLSAIFLYMSLVVEARMLQKHWMFQEHQWARQCREVKNWLTKRKVYGVCLNKVNK